MSIFRREPSEPPPQPAASPPPSRSASKQPKQESSPGKVSTHIAKGSKVVGQVSGNADLVIDGVVEGEIDLESRVVVGAEGRVEGKILAGSVEVGGKVQGNVKGLERVEVLATGSLEGDVMSPRVVIAEGAFFKGKVEMTDKITRDKPNSPKMSNPKSGMGKGGGKGKAGGPQRANTASIGAVPSSVSSPGMSKAGS